MRFLAWTVVVVGLAAGSRVHASEDAATPAETSSAAVGDTANDEKLLQEIEKATTSNKDKGEPVAETPTKVSGGGGLFSNIYNPAMSVNGLFLASVSSDRYPAADATATGLAIQELELQFFANVDPYFAATLMFSVPKGEGFGLEEGYLTPAAQPFGIGLRLGKIKVPFGRENPTHTHALPFVDKSLVGQAIFGDEGLGEVGAEASYLLPVPWYLSVAAAVYNGDNAVVFDARDPYAAMGFFGVKSVFDLSDDATLELGMSSADGRGHDNQLSQVWGGHLFFKWRPAHHALDNEAIVAVEAIYASQPNSDARPRLHYSADNSLSGAYAYIQWRLVQRWTTAVRYDYLGYPNIDYGIGRRGSVVLAFAPSEFSAIRVQGNASRRPGMATTVYEGLVQVNFTLGAHPAHSY